MSHHFAFHRCPHRGCRSYNTDIVRVLKIERGSEEDLRRQREAPAAQEGKEAAAAEGEGDADEESEDSEDDDEDEDEEEEEEEEEDQGEDDEEALPDAMSDDSFVLLGEEEEGPDSEGEGGLGEQPPPAGQP